LIVLEEGRSQAAAHRATIRRPGTNQTLTAFLARGCNVGKDDELRDLLDLCEIIHTNQAFEGIESPFRRLAVGDMGTRDISGTTLRRRLPLLHGIALLDGYTTFRASSSFSISFDFGSTSSGKDMCIVVYSTVNDQHEREEYIFDLINLSTTGHFSHPNMLAIARRLDIHTMHSQLLYGAMTDTAANVRRIADDLVTNLKSAITIARSHYYDALNDEGGDDFDDIWLNPDDGDDTDDAGGLRLARRGRGVKANEGDRAVKCICHSSLFLRAPRTPLLTACASQCSSSWFTMLSTATLL